ncbi:GIY-YIG nuclease family protein [Patescibacteria group bacterium]|nr:GIY-YIG nuclease family protein [Patescibacteria group bacterium]
MIEPVIWWVYIVRCVDGTLYTGVTTDLERRLQEHNGTGLAARYTRGRQPVSLAYTEEAADRSAALKREAALKKLPRTAKESLISG